MKSHLFFTGKAVFPMTSRTSWPLALSGGPGAMNADTFRELAEAGILQLELSSGAIAPFYDILDFL